MEKFPKYFLSFFILVIVSNMQAQVNCNSVEGENCRKACEIYNKATVSQGSRSSQESFDKAIALCSTFSNAYMEKSVPYLKRGDFIIWKSLIDKAVDMNPKMHLPYRAWCKFQFLRDYNGALADFDELEKLGLNINGYFSQNGDYNLEIVKAICYSGLGQKERAISIIEKQLSTKDYKVGLYDYYHLGATYFDVRKYDQALENFERQSKYNDFAENIYYKSKIAKFRNKDYLDLKKIALQRYDAGKNMKDVYTHHFNKIYRVQILEL